MKSLPSQQISVTSSSIAGQSPGGTRENMLMRMQETPDLASVLWRYRWAVILPAVFGCVIGFLIYLQLPETYRSTTRLMVESDRPAALDKVTGDALGGVPSIGILQAQLYSDTVVNMAYNDEMLRQFHDRFTDQKSFTRTVQEEMILEPEVTDERVGQSLVMLLHFDDQDPELCESSVHAFSDALQKFFNDRQAQSHKQLEEYISTAIDKLHPAVESLEKRYQEFRRDAKLAWDAEGKAINPYRERQLKLIERRSELDEKRGEKLLQQQAVGSIASKSSDPMVALKIIGQLLDVSIVVPTDNLVAQNLRDTDEKLQQLELDEQLVPLMIRRNNFAREFGDNHPTVQQLDAELELMKSELKRIVKAQAERIVVIMEQSQSEKIDPVERAKEAVRTVLLAVNAELQLLSEQIKVLNQQIEAEKAEAVKLANDEQKNDSMLREIDRNRQLVEQLQEQMARVSLADQSLGTRVNELSAPSPAYLVGPNLIAALGIGSFLGLALGAGLAFMLEKNANTFRDPDEIADFLGVPILTHLPFFRGRRKKTQKGEVNPFKDLDPYLAVIHAPASVAAEAIRSCRTSVFFETAGGTGGKVLQVTSPLPGDGKSTIAGNLACSIAQSGKRVLAIDCDLRRPQLTDNFSMSDSMGLTNVLNGECDPQEACHQTPLTTLRVMPSGAIPTNPAEALTLAEMRELLELLREEYDYIIIDTPPLLVVTDPSITASMVDGVLMTLRVRRKSKPNAKESINILRGVGAKILGVVINNSDEASSSDGYRGYGYYRYGRYTSRYYNRNVSGSSRDESTRSAGSPMVVSGRGVVPMRRSAVRTKITTDETN
jgi:succinoglycan biosynthesis transport protein ExoP